MAARTAFAVTIVIGVMWAAIGLVYGQPLQDFGIGAAVAGAGVLGLGAVDWLRR